MTEKPNSVIVDHNTNMVVGKLWAKGGGIMHEFNNQKPLYIQLIAIIEEAILNDVLKSDEAIPSIRVLAKDYRLNPLTVTNAIDNLVDGGILYKKRGIGMFVSDNAKNMIKEQQFDSFKTNELVSTIERAKLLGVSKQETESIVDKVYGGIND